MKPAALMFRVLPLTLLAVALALPALPAAAQADVDDDVVYEVVSEATNEPTQVEATPDGRLIWSERDGTINVITPGGVKIVAGELAPSGNLCETCTVEPDLAVPYNDPAALAGEVAADPQGLAACAPPVVSTAPIPPGCPLAPDRADPSTVGGLAEGGVHGLLVHRDFAENNLIFVYRSVAGTREEVAPGLFWGEFQLSTFRLDPTTSLLDPASEDVLLSVPAEWDHCCHYGGDLDYLPDGTITLTTGDDVPASSSSGYGPRDHRAPWLNAELTSANPADRRGKILRLREDGTVPDGSVEGEVPNPFLGLEGHNPYIDDSAGNVYVGDLTGTAPGDGWIAFDPYVYALGLKQPWRAAVMPNGDVYVSDVGPDAGSDDPERGPRGFEELNRVPFGGGTHAGWPRCVGPNWAYTDVNWETLETGGELDCSATAPVARPVGETAATVTGMTGAVMYYPSGACDGSQDAITTYDCNQWPIVGSGGKTSEPTAFYPADVEGPLALPERYRDRLLVLEWSRNFILTIPADPDTADLDLRNEAMDLITPPPYSLNPNVEQPLTSVSVQQGRLLSPIDGVIGPDGAFYFVEYGATYYAGENGRLSRIRAADAQLSAATNYGLPVTAPAPAAASALPALPFPLLSGLAVAAAGAAAAWRRRALVAS